MQKIIELKNNQNLDVVLVEEIESIIKILDSMDPNSSEYLKLLMEMANKIKMLKS